MAVSGVIENNLFVGTDIELAGRGGELRFVAQLMMVAQELGGAGKVTA